MCSGVIAPRAIHNKASEFAAVHNIKPTLEMFPLDNEGTGEAFEHLDHVKTRYRGILVCAAIEAQH